SSSVTESPSNRWAVPSERYPAMASGKPVIGNTLQLSFNKRSTSDRCCSGDNNSDLRFFNSRENNRSILRLARLGDNRAPIVKVTIRVRNNGDKIPLYNRQREAGTGSRRESAVKV